MSESKCISFLIVISPSDDISLLKNCLISIRDQSCKDFSVLIVENGILSISVLHQINSLLVNEGVDVKSIKLDLQLNLAKALNIGLNKIEADITLRLDPDDFCSLTRVERILSLLEKKRFSVIGSQIIEFEISTNRFYSRNYPCSLNKIKSQMLWNNQIAHSSVAFITSEINQLGGYPEILYQEDYALWIKCLSKGLSVANDSEVLTFMNIDGLHKRRSGKVFFKSEISLAQIKIESGLYRVSLIWISCVVRIVYRFLPPLIKQVFFRLTRISLKNQSQNIKYF